MKIKAIILSLVLISTTFASTIDIEPSTTQFPDLEPTKNSFVYFRTGFDPFPHIGFGTRNQKNSHGVDFGLSTGTVLLASQIQGYCNYLFYPNPDELQQSYLLLGATGGIRHEIGFFDAPASKGLAGSLQAGFGKEYRSKRGKVDFYQLSAGYDFSNNFTMAIIFGKGF